jgi:NTE family protein
MADWRKALVNWRCALPEAERHRYGVPPAWNCRDLEFFISKISFDQLGPDRAAALNNVETRFKLPPDQVDMLVTAGRDALGANPKFRGFLTSFGRTPPPLPPAAPGAPVATSDSAAQQAAAE